DWRAVMEIRLRKLLPQRVVEKVSLLDTLLQAIESRLRNACDVMLPALRRALNTFTQRADIIIRQLSYIHTQGGDDVVDLCRQISQLSETEQNKIFNQHALELARMQLAFVDPGQIQWRAPWQKAVIRSSLETEKALDPKAQKELFIQQALDQ